MKLLCSCKNISFCDKHRSFLPIFTGFLKLALTWDPSMSQKRDFYNVFGTMCDALFKNISFCNELGIILEQGRPQTYFSSK